MAFPLKDGRVTTPEINRVLGKPSTNPDAEAAYRALCTVSDVVPAKKERQYWEFGTAVELAVDRVLSGELGYRNVSMTLRHHAS